ncbi:MAG: hypothetical protein ACRDO8_12500 [Nocardioidaceae bacterium]
MSSQLSAPAHFTAHHPTGGPTDIPNILSVDGNALAAGARGGAVSPGQVPKATSPEVVDTAETVTTAQAVPEPPQVQGPVVASGPAEVSPAGDALAMLAHSRTTKPAPQPATDEADADSQQPPAPSETDHSIPDRLGPTAGQTQRPGAGADHGSRGLVEHLVGSVKHLDVTGGYGLPPRNAPLTGDDTSTERPPHDTALPSLSGQLPG